MERQRGREREGGEEERRRGREGERERERGGDGERGGRRKGDKKGGKEGGKEGGQEGGKEGGRWEEGRREGGKLRSERAVHLKPTLGLLLTQQRLGSAQGLDLHSQHIQLLSTCTLHSIRN